MLTQSLLDALPFIAAMGVVSGIAFAAGWRYHSRLIDGYVKALRASRPPITRVDPKGYKDWKCEAAAGIAQTTASSLDPVGAAGVLESATQENTGPAAGEQMQNSAKQHGFRAESLRGMRAVEPGRAFGSLKAMAALQAVAAV
jgi:hypothetical protein